MTFMHDPFALLVLAQAIVLGTVGGALYLTERWFDFDRARQRQWNRTRREVNRALRLVNQLPATKSSGHPYR